MLTEFDEPDESKCYDIVWHDVLFNPGIDFQEVYFSRASKCGLTTKLFRMQDCREAWY